MIDDLAGEVAGRLSGTADRDRRLQHVRAVVATVRQVASGSWPPEVARAAERAAWFHDALKPDGVTVWREQIAVAGETPDPWAAAHAPDLLHAQAAATWAAAWGEREAAVLDAVRHHPTAHADWGPVGRLLYVADFCEPTRPFHERLGCSALLTEATRGPAGLNRVAQRVLALRVEHLIGHNRPIHPDGWRAWNAWTESGR